eukprot:364777-Chlamydomonas_euryale.AAC.9
MQCSVRHAPCAMHHAPWTMHHAPWTMHHAPCTMHHAPCAMHQCAAHVFFASRCHAALTTANCTSPLRVSAVSILPSRDSLPARNESTTIGAMLVVPTTAPATAPDAAAAPAAAAVAAAAAAAAAAVSAATVTLSVHASPLRCGATRARVGGQRLSPTLAGCRADRGCRCWVFLQRYAVERERD